MVAGFGPIGNNEERAAVAQSRKLFRPDVILSAATAGRGTLRRPTPFMPWMGVPALPAVQPLLASIQAMSGFRKVPPERWARSCGMTSMR